jgi:hypothetical protein
LHCGGSLLEISTLYVDTTFCHPIGTEIPSRDTSRDIILKLIERWLAKDPTNVVHLQCACFGYEHIFMGIHKKFKTKIHIAPWKMNAYREISAVTDCLTTNGDSTNIHTCTYQKGQNEKKESSGLPCGSCQRNGAPPNVLRIKPSTQWFLFNKKSTTHPCVFLPQSNKFRVIHSMHASFRELRDFITYVRPRRIVPCVIPFGDASLSDVCARLKGLLPQTEVGSSCVESEEQRKRLKRSHSQKKSGEDAAVAAESSEDSWSTGDESIDEFTSTGEPSSSVEAERTVFTHTPSHSTRISLPSLLGIEDQSSSPPPSADSSVTLGTLVQSPIDLSLSPSLESVVSSQSGATITDGTKTVSNTSSSQSTVVPSQLLQTNLPEIGDEKSTFQNVVNEFGCDGEGNSSLCEVGTPHSKRVRLSEERSPVSRQLFTGTAADCEQVAKEEKYDEDKEEGEEDEEEESEEESIDGEEKSPPNSPLVIDLTEDEEDNTLVPSETPELIDLTDDQLTPPPPQEPLSKRETHSLPTSTGEGGHHAPNVVHGIRLSSPVVLELSDSQTSGSTSSGCSVRSKRSVSVESTHRALGSPNCLPPTPGRENVHSILQRPDFP